jgi:uncharacterized membrane protein YcjF (UPF0283 family)
MKQTSFDQMFAMCGMIVLGLASLAASAAIIYLLYAAAQWLMANA